MIGIVIGFLLGIISASVLIYYGMMLFSKITFSNKQETPLGKSVEIPTEQESTNE
mgnify:CR=1 FL=1